MKKTRQAKSPRQVARRKKPQVRARGHEDFLTASIDTARPGAAPGAAPEAKRSLGERIREAREMRGLTLEDLSSRSGISVDGLERVEANRATPPLGQLVRLGKALEMKMGYFLSAGVDKPMSVVRADARPKIARHGKQRSEQYGYVYESLAPEKANRLMEPFLVTMVPTEFGEFSSHDGQEFLFVLEGEIRTQVGKEVEVLRPGDSIYYDSTHPHLVKCHGGRPAKILAVIHAGAK
jgi:transcriptional regulator with XRE-family HTH domain